MTTKDSTNSLSAKPRRAAAAASRQPKAATSTKATSSKSDIVGKLLARPKGATIAEVSNATGWQAHSVRAFFSGLRKKGSALERELRKDGTSGYRLVRDDSNPTSAADVAPEPAPDERTPAVSGDEA
jgi:hypothetical protein